MKLKTKLANFIDSQKIKFLENKTKYLFNNCIYLTIGLLFFLMPAMSGTRFHNIPVILSAILSVAIIIYIFIFGKFYINKSIFNIILFCLVTVLSTLLNGRGIRNIKLTYFLVSGLFIILYEFFMQDKKIDKVMSLFLCAICMFMLVFFVVYAKDIVSLDFTRIGGKFGNVNEVGFYFLLGFVFSVYYVLFKKKYHLIPLVLLFVVCGFLTGSKKILFGVGISSIAYLFYFFGRKKWYISVIIIMILIGVIILLLQLPMFSFFKNRILELLSFIGIVNNGFIDVSSITRTNMIIDGMHLFSLKPILGFGVDGFALNTIYNTYSHSTISELLCNFGIIGFVLFYAPLFGCFKILDHKKNNYRPFLVSVLLTIIFLTLTSVILDIKIYYVMLAILCCILESDKTS